MVRRYQEDIQEFGEIAFEMRNSAFETLNGDAAVATSSQGRPTEYALLNEQQSTLLMTYMRNSEVVREFKKRLVKAFYELAQNRHRDPVALLGDPAAMRGLLLNYSEKVIALEEQVSEQARKLRRGTV